MIDSTIVDTVPMVYSRPLITASILADTAWCQRGHIYSNQRFGERRSR